MEKRQRKVSKRRGKKKEGDRRVGKEREEGGQGKGREGKRDRKRRDAPENCRKSRFFGLLHAKFHPNQKAQNSPE